MMLQWWKQFGDKRITKEIIFQVLLHVLLFSYHISGTQHGVALHDFIYFIVYAIAAFIINYQLFPKLYYKQKFSLFILGIFIVFNVVIVVEEFVLQALLFPDNRGYRFPGYFAKLFDFLPLMALIVGAKFAWDAHIKQRELDLLKTEIKSSELQILKNQINPHFLFNNLNSLYAYALEGSPKTTKIILELSSVLRYILYDCEENYVSLKKEIEQLKSFVALNELQLEERGIVNLITNIKGKRFQIAPLILTVFIENAFKHSSSSQIKNISIDISVEVSHKGVLTFSCRNNFSEQTNTTNLPKGIGLMNVKKRLELLYLDSHQLTTAIDDGIYNVELKLDLTHG